MEKQSIFDIISNMWDIMKDELRSITLVDQLEKKLLQYIQKSELKNGDPLPSELFFAEKYNVSRNLVRETLSRLKMLNIIESRRRRGMIIKDPDPMANFVKVAKPSLLSERSMLDLIELRSAIEIGISPMIFRNVTDDDIDDLEKIVSEEEQYKGVRVGVDNEIKFHTRVYQIVNNNALMAFQNVVIPIFGYINDNFSEFDEFNKELKIEGRLVTHRDLVRCIKNRDQRGYKDSIENHLRAYVNYVHDRKLSLD